MYDNGEICFEVVDEGSVLEVLVENIFNDVSVCVNEYELDNFFFFDEIKKLKEKKWKNVERIWKIEVWKFDFKIEY